MKELMKIVQSVNSYKELIADTADYFDEYSIDDIASQIRAMSDVSTRFYLSAVYHAWAKRDFSMGWKPEVWLQQECGMTENKSEQYAKASYMLHVVDWSQFNYPPSRIKHLSNLWIYRDDPTQLMEIWERVDEEINAANELTWDRISSIIYAYQTERAMQHQQKDTPAASFSTAGHNEGVDPSTVEYSIEKEEEYQERIKRENEEYMQRIKSEPEEEPTLEIPTTTPGMTIRKPKSKFATASKQVSENGKQLILHFSDGAAMELDAASSNGRRVTFAVNDELKEKLMQTEVVAIALDL